MPIVRYVVRGKRYQPPVDVEPFRTLPSRSGGPWVLFYRWGASYLLRFPGLVDFTVSGDGKHIHCWTVPGVTEATLGHIYWSHVAPLALSVQDRTVLHGSVVEVEDGALAFLGVSGQGKSTLAASFAVAGFRLLSDDAVILDGYRDLYQVLPSHPWIRLWDDSREALIKAPTPLGPPLQFTSKARLLEGGKLTFCDESRALRRVYFLGDGTAQTVAIRSIHPGEALVRLLEHSFLLDIEAKDLIAARFKRVAQMVRSVNCCWLDYPREFKVLGEVQQAILEHHRDRGDGGKKFCSVALPA